MFKTHMAFAFLVGLFSIQYLSPRNDIMFMVLVLFGAALVDIDHPNSKVGRRVKVVAYLFEHRGFFHSLFALPAVASAVYLLTNDLLLTLPILIGYLSHIIVDALTVEGIMPFHPLLRFRIRGIFRTGHSAEFLLFLGLIALNSIYLLRL